MHQLLQAGFLRTSIQLHYAYTIQTGKSFPTQKHFLEIFFHKQSYCTEFCVLHNLKIVSYSIAKNGALLYRISQIQKMFDFGQYMSDIRVKIQLVRDRVLPRLIILPYFLFSRRWKSLCYSQRMWSLQSQVWQMGFTLSYDFQKIQGRCHKSGKTFICRWRVSIHYIFHLVIHFVHWNIYIRIEGQKII